MIPQPVQTIRGPNAGTGGLPVNLAEMNFFGVTQVTFAYLRWVLRSSPSRTWEVPMPTNVSMNEPRSPQDRTGVYVGNVLLIAVFSAIGLVFLLAAAISLASLVGG